MSNRFLGIFRNPGLYLCFLFYVFMPVSCVQLSCKYLSRPNHMESNKHDTFMKIKMNVLFIYTHFLEHCDHSFRDHSCHGVGALKVGWFEVDGGYD